MESTSKKSGIGKPSENGTDNTPVLGTDNTVVFDEKEYAYYEDEIEKYKNIKNRFCSVESRWCCGMPSLCGEF